MLITSFVISWLYWVFPVAPSTAAVQASLHTVGLFHKVVRFVLGAQYEHIFFFCLFLLRSANCSGNDSGLLSKEKIP